MNGNRCQAFSLLEVMIAVAILAVSFLALINFQGQTMFRVGRAERLTKATFLAQQKMAELLLEIEKEQVQQRVFPDDKTEDGVFDKPYETYRWEMQIRKVSIPTPEDTGGDLTLAMLRAVTAQIGDQVREVKLIVKWEELGKEKNIEVVSHIAKL